MIAAQVPMALGLSLFMGRNGAEGGAPHSPAIFVWERGGWLAAVFLTALGLILLEGSLLETKGRVLARLGASAYFFGAVVVVVAEAMPFPLDRPSYPLIVIYVVLAFLGQVAVGIALLQSALLAAWVGWTILVWNVGWLVALPIVSPDDLYYPILHHVMPLLIGIMLVVRR
jgi:hypothetical protein